MARWLSAFRRYGLLLAFYSAMSINICSKPAYAIIEDDPSADIARDEKFMAAERLVKERQYAEAIPLLQQVLARDPGNADAYNYLAFSQRKVGLFQEALHNYLRALDLDPDHIGAREYLGELYLQLNQDDKAEEQLARLKVLCPLGCEAREDLARAIEESRRRRGGI